MVQTCILGLDMEWPRCPLPLVNLGPTPLLSAFLNSYTQLLCSPLITVPESRSGQTTRCFEHFEVVCGDGLVLL